MRLDERWDTVLLHLSGSPDPNGESFPPKEFTSVQPTRCDPTASDQATHCLYTWLYTSTDAVMKELHMAVTSVDLDPQLMERARQLSGERSNRAVIDLALRRFVASMRKTEMVDGIAALSGLEAGLDAPLIEPNQPG